MISVAVMAHPKRAGFVKELLPLLDREAEVIWDQRDDRWDTGRRSMLAFDPAASHHLVIQDDAIPCRDLVAGLERAVEFSGEHPLGLYMGRQNQKLSRLAKQVPTSGWIANEGPWWGPGIVVRTDQIPEMVEWCDGRSIPNYDRRITRYYATQGIACWYSVPSLVEHRSDHESLVPGRNSTGRVAARFLGQDRSALELDWSAEPLRLPTGNARFRHLRSGQVKEAREDSDAYERMNREPNVWEPIPQPR